MSEDSVDEIDQTDPPEEDVKDLMETHDIDKDTAERVVEIMDEYGVDEDDAIELEDAGL